VWHRENDAVLGRCENISILEHGLGNGSELSEIKGGHFYFAKRDISILPLHMNRRRVPDFMRHSTS
jgi:hypothetical protein